MRDGPQQVDIASDGFDKFPREQENSWGIHGGIHVGRCEGIAAARGMQPVVRMLFWAPIRQRSEPQSDRSHYVNRRTTPVFFRASARVATLTSVVPGETHNYTPDARPSDDCKPSGTSGAHTEVARNPCAQFRCCREHDAAPFARAESGELEWRVLRPLAYRPQRAFTAIAAVRTLQI